MGNKYINNFDDYDENIDIISDSSRMPKKNSKSSRNPQKPQTQRSQNRQYQRRPQRSQNQHNQKTQKLPYIQHKQQTKARAAKKKPKTPGRIFAKVFFTVILICILILALAFGYISNIFGDMKYKDTNKDNAYIDESLLIGDSGVKNILLIGGDAREGETSYRSDTMMLVSIDTNNEKIKLTSFLRDSYVEIPGRGYAKLNAACSYGGIQLVIDTIEYNFKIKIDNFAMVDFDAFEGIVDTLGGVDVDVEQRESSFINRTSGTKIPAGNVHLNGKQALLYCRIRKLDSDFYRTQRQRKVMSAIKNKASDASLSTVLKTAETIMPYVESDISKSEMMALSMKAATTYLKYDVEQMNIPADKTWSSGKRNGGQSVLLFDIGENTQILHKFIYGNND